MDAVAFRSQMPADTLALGRRLGQLLAGGEVIALSGELGAGKTTLVQGLAAGLNIQGRVTSPTFTLVNEYQGSQGRRLLHIDLYRLGDSTQGALAESTTFGLPDLLGGADPWTDDDVPPIVAVEWAERVAALLPADYLEVTLAHVEGAGRTREIRFVAHGPISARLLQRLIALQS
jgi:tRNA threonylcarbamoyladenosine biosynthesis protein TsaE